MEPRPSPAAALRGDDGSLRLLKRRLYGAYLVAAALGAAALLFVPPGNTPEATLVVRAVVPPTLAAFVVLVYLLWRRPQSVSLVERVIYVLSFPVFLSIPLLIVAGGASELAVEMALRSVSLWSPIALVWAFVAFGSRRGAIAASAFLLSMGVVLTHVGRIATAAGVPLPFAPVDTEYLVANVILVLSLYAFSSFLERQTAARAAAEAEARFATVDHLTGLWNRRALEPHLQNAIALAERLGRAVAVFFLDVDGLKAVNDTFGHDGGDAVLAQFARRLTSTVRASDAVARMGGDEFVVVAQVRDAGEAQALAEKLRAAAAAPFLLAHEAVHVTISVGVALHPDHGSSAEELMRRADDAMYRAKASGKDAVRVAARVPIPG